MRPDMPKIAVERPRFGHADRYPRGSLKSDYGPDLEDHPRREAMSWRRYGTKGFSDNLAPLYRFLRANVGRPWDRIWSEMCAHISFDNPVQKHVLGHVFGVVEAHVQLRDGDVYAISRGFGARPDAPLRGRGRWPALYVCPKTGLLRQAKHVSRRAAPKAPDPNIVVINPGQERLRRVLGIWYREELGHTETGEVIVRTKRQLGARELQRLGLCGGAS
jgi:hypothetical protein